MSRSVLGPWWGLLLSAAGVALGVAAGTWQLGRAAEKRELENLFATGAGAAAIARLVTDTESGPLRYRLLRLEGGYDPAHQVLLDNISRAGTPGYDVLTAFRTGEGSVLVNRGWVRADGDRRVLPDLTVDAGARTVTGRIERLPRPGLRLAAPLPPADAPWPRRLLFPTAAELRTQLGTNVREYQLLLDPAAADGFMRDWRPGGMPPERHTAYAVQWFGLALTVVIIHVVLVFRAARKPS